MHELTRVCLYVCMYICRDKKFLAMDGNNSVNNAKNNVSSNSKEKSSAQIDEIKTLRVSFIKSGGLEDRKSGYVLWPSFYPIGYCITLVLGYPDRVWRLQTIILGEQQVKILCGEVRVRSMRQETGDIQMANVLICIYIYCRWINCWQFMYLCSDRAEETESEGLPKLQTIREVLLSKAATPSSTAKKTIPREVPGLELIRDHGIDTYIHTYIK